MTKLILQNVENFENQTTAAAAINSNSSKTTSLVEDTFSRSGVGPNTINTTIDMNSHRIINLPFPSGPLQPVRLIDIENLVVTKGGTPVPAGGTAGQVLTKKTNATFDVDWETIPGNTFNLGDYTVGDGVTDDFIGISACIAAAVAVQGTIVIPDGTYAHGLPINWGFSRLRVIPLGEGAHFRHIGTGIAHKFNGIITTGGQGCVGGVFGGRGHIFLSGNPSGGTTDVVEIDNWHFGEMKVVVRNGATGVHGKDTGVVGASAVCSVFDIRISDNVDAAFAVQPGSGVIFDSPVACVFNNLIVEGVGVGSNYGVVLTNAVANQFSDGTVESCISGGISIDINCKNNIFSSMHVESNNVGKDWIIRGSNNTFIQCGGSGTTLGSSIYGSNNFFQGTTFQSLTIETGAIKNRFINPTMLTAFTDNGTSTMILGASGGLSILDKVPFIGTVSNTVTKDDLTSFDLSNPSTGTTAGVGLSLSNLVGTSVFGLGGTALSTTLLRNRAYISAGGASNGIALYTATPLPIVFATNGVEAGRFDDTGAFTLGGTLNGVRVTPASPTATLTMAGGKTLVVNNSLTVNGTDGTTMTLPTTNATLARTDAGQTFTGTQVFSSTINGNISGNAATVTTNANLTGAVTSSGNATSLGSFTSSNLKTALTDETGSGAAVFANSPALVTPTGIVKGDVGLGSVDNTSDTTKWAATKTLTNTTYDTAGTGNSFSINGIAATANTGTGSVVRATSPTLVTPVLGVATATSINGANIDNNAWTSYSPTITSQGGTFTGATITATGRYKQIGKTVFLQADVLLTALGSGSPINGLRVSLPFAAAAFNFSGSSTEIVNTGRLGRAIIAPSGTTVDTRQYDGTSWITAGNQVIVGITYEVP